MNLCISLALLLFLIGTIVTLEKHMNTTLNLEETESKRVDSYATKYNFINPPPNFVFQ